MRKCFRIISPVVIVAAPSSIPSSIGFARDFQSPATLEFGSELIYMGVGLVLMIMPWVWYFIRWNRDKDED